MWCARPPTRWRAPSDNADPGAPAIGIAAAMGLAMAARTIHAPTFAAFYASLEEIGANLVRTRPPP